MSPEEKAKEGTNSNIIDEDVYRLFVSRNQVSRVIFTLGLFDASLKITTESLFAPRASGRVTNWSKGRRRSVLFRSRREIQR